MSWLTRPVGLLAAFILLIILLGCMSISIGKFSGTSGTTESDGTFCQEGEATVSPGVIREVYYPVPYAHTPNLEISDTFNNCILVTEREGSFSVRNDSSHSVSVSWKARGQKAAPPAVVVPPESVLPPPAPVPVEVPASTGK
jgi:hypothetical protein